MADPRPCERRCKPVSQGGCGEWKHYSRFHSWKDKRRSNSTIAVQFSPLCRDCEQRIRNEKKNADRPLAIIENRARAMAVKVGESFEFVWIQLNYRSLVPLMRAMMTPEGLCQGCGHDFVNERDIQIEHLEPPRIARDFARQHTRNLRLFCGSCNGTKGKKPFAVWLDEQEGARLSNLTDLKLEPEAESQFDFSGSSNDQKSTNEPSHKFTTQGKLL
jgi:5-methylcytosine-specific restriction endonuclease McrA